MLRAARGQAAGEALGFVVVLPGWTDCEGYSALLGAAPLLRRTLLVAARDHGFVDGGQHARPRGLRESPYASTLDPTAPFYSPYPQTTALDATSILSAVPSACFQVRHDGLRPADGECGKAVARERRGARRDRARIRRLHAQQRSARKGGAERAGAPGRRRAQEAEDEARREEDEGVEGGRQVVACDVWYQWSHERIEREEHSGENQQ